MTTFYDLQNRQHTLTGVDACFTYLHSLHDNTTIKIANDHFKVIFQDRPFEKVHVPAWPIIYTPKEPAHVQ